MPALQHYKPWLDDLLKEKPFQLDEKLEQLFTDKSQTSAGAWNRLFSDTMAALRFEVDGEAEPLALEPTLNLLTDADEGRRQAGAEALAKTFEDNIRVFHADHQYARQGQGDFRPVARLSRILPTAAISPTGSRGRSSRRWSMR